MARDQQKLKEWQKANKERIRLQKQEYYLKNKDKINARNAKYSFENREKVYERQRKWREQKRLKNLKKYKGITEKTKKIHEKRFSGLREIVIQRDKEKCIDCGITRQEHIKRFGVDITVDHINGIGRNSDQPENILENLATRCLPCHGRKDQKRLQKSRDQE